MSVNACLYFGFNHHKGKTGGNKSLEQEEASQVSDLACCFLMDVFFVRHITKQEYFMICKIEATYVST